MTRQWAENPGLVWFPVLDHMIHDPRVGAADEPAPWQGGTVLAGLAAVRIRLATLATAVGCRNPTHRQDPRHPELPVSVQTKRCDRGATRGQTRFSVG
jgi:hypothetical protein